MRVVSVLVVLSLLLCGCGVTLTPTPAPPPAPRLGAPTTGQPAGAATRLSTPTRVIAPPAPTPTSSVAPTVASLPRFLYFWRPNCVYCGQMDPIVDALEKEYTGRITFTRLNTYEAVNAPLVQKYKITGVPASVLLSSTGTMLGRWIGLTQADRLRQGITTAGIR